jgi:hypothetical protein
MKTCIDLSKYGDNLTIAQLKKAIEQDEILKKERETEEINTIKNEFENTYLKRLDKNSLFGKELEVFELRELIRHERTTEWNLVYYFEGRKTSFSNRHLFDVEFDTNRCENSFSTKDLRGMLKISKEEYQEYLDKYSRISTELKEIIK